MDHIDVLVDDTSTDLATPLPRTPAPPTRQPDLPEAFAPFVYNAWYVVAERQDIGRELRAIKALGEPLVMYRTEAGEPVVLDDRCAHRRFPLSKSKRVGDTIQCGYHGFTYDQTGRCLWAPGLPVQPRFGVRRYPTAEVGPWLWVWMGDAAKANPATIPYPAFNPADLRHVSTGYKHNPGNYMLLIENILDLTHLHFLHGADVADLAQTNTPPKSAPQRPNAVGWIKETARTQAGMIAALIGANPEQFVHSILTDTQFGPSMNHGYQDFTALPDEEGAPYPMRFHVLHAITPEDENNTHQFFQTAFNVDLVHGIDHFRDILRDHVFEQDTTAIRHMQQVIQTDQRTGPVEFGIPSDRFGVSMRRILRNMAETNPATPT